MNIAVCAKWTYNVHNDRTYESRNSKHLTTSCSDTKPFY